MYRSLSLPTHGLSALSMLESDEEPTEEQVNELCGWQDSEAPFPLDLSHHSKSHNREVGRPIEGSDSDRRVVAPAQPDLDTGGQALVMGHGKDNDGKVKDAGLDRHYLYRGCQQELDFSHFEADVHRSSSLRDLTSLPVDVLSSSQSMAPVITLTPPMSPSRNAHTWRHLPLDMLGGKVSGGRAYSRSGYSTPVGNLTPSGTQTPTGMRTPLGSSSGPAALKKSSSVVNLIHYHNLENVAVSELYAHPPDLHGQDGISGQLDMNMNLNALPSDRDFGRAHLRGSQSSEKLHAGRKYKSRSCPHSRHHSPPRQRPRIETVTETEGSLPDLVAASSRADGELEDNYLDCENMTLINHLDDNLNLTQDLDSAAGLPADALARSRSSSWSFAALFNRCRYERDTSMPNTPYEGDNHTVDPQLLMNKVHDFLCAERVSQMTRTYNDIEAVTRLLEEKERDLELAARIGQTLLSKNKELSSRTENLEEQLSLTIEKVNQLRHDINMKDELLRFYNEDLDHDNSGNITPNDKSTSLVNVDFLEKKVKTLEDENQILRLESSQLKSETVSYEEKEKRLVEDCIQQLAEVKLQLEYQTEELHLKVEENNHYKEEVTVLLAQIADLQTKIRKLTQENLDIHEKLTASTETQRKLTKDLGTMQDKCDELFEMFEESQDELRVLRGKQKIRSSDKHHHSAFNNPTDSLASELETSLQQELSQSRRRSYSWKVFETAKAAKRAAAKAAQRESSIGTGHSRISPLATDSQVPSAYPSDAESLASDGYSADMDSLYGSNPELGQPGIPGSNDLENILKHLAMPPHERNDWECHHDEEEERRGKKILAAMSGGTSPFGMRSPMTLGRRSPSGSAASTTWSSSGLPHTSPHYKFSEKLQIVKPMEGSVTLRHWQHLATPNLGGIFEERDGVQIKGEKKLDLKEEVYSLSDLEEDDAPDVNEHTAHRVLTTYTDSTMHNLSSQRGHVSPLGTSTPKGALAGDEYAQQSQTSLETGETTPTTKSAGPVGGLASLLNAEESTPSGHALTRVSVLGLASSRSESSTTSTTAVSSSADLNQVALSSRSFGGNPFPSTLTRSIPGSRSFEQAMREYEEKKKASFDSSSSQKKPELFAPGMTGKGFLQQLKSKGFSLYGLWSQDSQPAAASNVATSSPDSSPTTKATAESVFSNGAGVGVLGALTNFRRNGMF